MVGLIIIFSALGGTLGSRAMGYLFADLGPAQGFYYTLIPIGALLLALISFENDSPQIKNNPCNLPAAPDQVFKNYLSIYTPANFGRMER